MVLLNVELRFLFLKELIMNSLRSSIEVSSNFSMGMFFNFS